MHELSKPAHTGLAFLSDDGRCDGAQACCLESNARN